MTSLSFPKKFRFRPMGRSRVIVPLILLLGIAFLLFVGVVFRFIVTFSGSWPLRLGMLLFDLLLLLIAVFLLRAYYLITSAKLILTQQGIFYHAGSATMYTPWKNVQGIGEVRRGLPSVGLRLQTPAEVGRNVREGVEQEIAVIEPTWLAIGGRAWPFTEILPIDPGLVGPNWLQDEFGLYLRTYAPQIFQEKETFSSVDRSNN